MNAPLVVICPILFAEFSVNQRAPSGPDVITNGWLLDVGIAYSANVPFALIRPILLPLYSANQSAPSDPAASSSEPEFDVGMLYSRNVPQMEPSKATDRDDVAAEPPPLPGVTVGVSVIELLPLGIPGRVRAKVFGEDEVGAVTASCVGSLDVRVGTGAPGPTMKLPSASTPTTVTLWPAKHFESAKALVPVLLRMLLGLGMRATAAGTP